MSHSGYVEETEPAFALRYGRCGICGEHYTLRLDHLVFQHGWTHPTVAKETVDYLRRTLPPTVLKTL